MFILWGLCHTEYNQHAIYCESVLPFGLAKRHQMAIFKGCGNFIFEKLKHLLSFNKYNNYKFIIY